MIYDPSLDFETQIELLLHRRTLPLDALAGLEAGKVFVALRAEGRRIDVKDALQAGICLRIDLLFATRNLRHFERVPGLRLDRPSRRRRTGTSNCIDRD